MDFRPTLNLPDPAATIPMKANLPELEPRIQARWESDRIYHRLQQDREHAPSFVLHDGPPYTNSPIHIGTALNKILKDLVTKSRSMMGYRTPYVPGFDNHGLPIEQAVARAFAEKKIEPTMDELRKAAREHAAKYIEVQTKQFQRLGVFGLWERPYTTMDPKFEAGIVRVFGRLMEAGLVYRGLRPTLWSPTSRTALADTEIVYMDHVSKAIYVAFPLLGDPEGVLNGIESPEAVIWTTTPWTIPSNQALAFHPDFQYSVVKVGDRHFVVATDLVERVASVVGWENPEVVRVLDGAVFENVVFSHPIFNRPSRGVLANYVTAEDGTGIVHTAPSHGRDDYYTGLKYSLPVPNTVDERGVLTEETGEFAGTYYKACDTVVVDRLQEVGALLDVRDFNHSYPHAERDEKPVIFRATEQWFVGLDNEELRARSLEEIQQVEWIPAAGQSRIEAMVQNRPDWCISRQRPWGVGIPILYTKNGRKPVMDPAAVEAIAQMVEREGSDGWFLQEPHEFLPEGYSFEGESEFTKETDVLDVWFDSGSTAQNVLRDPIFPEWQGQHYPADLYLEGSDQHRGWFNSSLLIGVGATGEAPYKQVLTHGFIVDESGRKMSKRLGNVVDPVEASEKFGADIIRYWVASVDYQSDAPCSMKILEQVGGLYRDVRNTLRFLLGNISGYKADAELLPFDQWIIEETERLSAEVVAAYEEYRFTDAIVAIHTFCRERLSKFYLDAIKDRMYCDLLDWPSRQSGARACAEVSRRLILLLAPVTAHTAEEAWEKLAELTGEEHVSVHRQTFLVPDDARQLELEGGDLALRYEALLALRERSNAGFEPFKGTDGIKNSQDAVVTIGLSAEDRELLSGFDAEELANALRVSEVTLTDGDEVTFARSPYAECARSRVRRADVAEVEIEGETVALTARDRRALGVA